MAASARVSRIDYLNRAAELTLTIEQRTSKKPSEEAVVRQTAGKGPQRFSPKREQIGPRTIFSLPPISERGVEVGATIYGKAIENGHSPNAILDAFVELQFAMEHADAGTPESTDDLAKAAKTLESISGTPLSAENIDDLFGFASYIPSGQLGLEYGKTLAVHRAIMGKLPAGNPLTEGIYRQLFVNFREVMDATVQYQILGFSPGLKTPTPWKTVEDSESISLYGFDVASLSTDVKDEIRRVYDETMTSPAGWKATESALRKLGDIKKRLIANSL